jgi:hypothetical protein
MQMFSTTSLSSLGEVDFGLIVGECPGKASIWIPPTLFSPLVLRQRLHMFLARNPSNRPCFDRLRTGNFLPFPDLTLTRKVGKLSGL